MTAALVSSASAQLRMRGGSHHYATPNGHGLASSPHPAYAPLSQPGSWTRRRVEVSAQPLRSLSGIPNFYPWGPRRSSTADRATTALHSRYKEKSSFSEDAPPDILTEEGIADVDVDTSLQLVGDGNNRTDDGESNTATFGTSTAEAPGTPSLELWGMPVGSVILLNLVAVIWGTQHAVIKSVVDDGTVGLGAGFVSWLGEMGVNLSVLQNGIPDQGGAGGDGTAAYFTLARFGLAAMLASPYTPGIRGMLGTKDSTAEVNGSDNLSSEEFHERQNGQAAISPKNTSTSDDRESVRLAWKYGAELGLYMFLGYAFQAVGLETTTASRSGFLLYLNVKFVPFFSYFIFGKRIQRSTWISALVAFGGTALLAFDNANAAGAENAFGMAFTVGDLWSMAAAAASAMFILRMEAASKAVPKSSELNAANLWTVAALSLLWTLGLSWNQLGGAQAGVDASAEFVTAMQQTFERTLSTIIMNPLPLIYLSGVTTALANFLQSKAQKDVSAERASVIYAMDPVYGAIFANLLLGETLGSLGLVGAFLIVVAAATNAVLDFGGVAPDDAVEIDGVRAKEKR